MNWARDQQDFEAKLSRAWELPKPTARNQEDALIHIALTFTSAPETRGDYLYEWGSRSWYIWPSVPGFIDRNTPDIEREIAMLRRWIGSDPQGCNDSYNVWKWLHADQWSSIDGGMMPTWPETRWSAGDRSAQPVPLDENTELSAVCLSAALSFAALLKTQGFLREIEGAFGLLTPKERRRSILLIISMQINAVLGFVGLAGVLPFVYLMLEPAPLDGSGRFAVAFRWLGFSDTNTALATFGLFLIGVIVLKNVYSYVHSGLQANFCARAEARLASDLLFENCRCSLRLDHNSKQCRSARRSNVPVDRVVAQKSSEEHFRSPTTDSSCSSLLR